MGWPVGSCSVWPPQDLAVRLCPLPGEPSRACTAEGDSRSAFLSQLPSFSSP